MQVQKKSHPTWVRGLKQTKIADIQRQQEVAPYVGAWIETLIVLRYVRHVLSHPTWVRGLKHVSETKVWSLCRSHPTWVRGLKLIF